MCPNDGKWGQYPLRLMGLRQCDDSHKLANRVRVAFCELYLVFVRAYAKMHMLLQEIDSLLGHISMRQSGLHFVAIDRNPEIYPTAHQSSCTYTCNRTEDTLRMLANHPWASLVDLQMFLNGWDRGEISGRATGNQCCGNQPLPSKSSLNSSDNTIPY
jgi:hypothetical protein